jgi:hypothetical protein
MAERLQIIITATDNTQQAFRSATQNLQSIGSAALGVAAVGITALGVGLARVGMEAFGLASDFQNATSAIIVGTGASGQALAEMEQITKNLKGSTAGLGVEFGTLGAVVAEVNTRTGATGQTLEDFSTSVLELSR